MNFNQLNSMPESELAIELEKCCGSEKWIDGIIKNRPYENFDELINESDEIWSKTTEKDHLQAFDHHPRIGDVDSLAKKFASTAKWASSEQQATEHANKELLQALKQANDNYFDKFGFIFIVCATGKTAQQMLDILNARISNDKTTERQIAATEQNKITHLRLQKLLETKKHNIMSPITTHILDTAKGCPAAGIAVQLEFLENNKWQQIAKACTDDDGRIMDWMEGEIQAGEYRIIFETANYHQNQGFFPRVCIDFIIQNPQQHYHVPLLLSPFSFSTYRGS